MNRTCGSGSGQLVRGGGPNQVGRLGVGLGGHLPPLRRDLSFSEFQLRGLVFVFSLLLLSSFFFRLCLLLLLVEELVAPPLLPSIVLLGCTVKGSSIIRQCILRECSRGRLLGCSVILDVGFAVGFAMGFAVGFAVGFCARCRWA